MIQSVKFMIYSDRCVEYVRKKTRVPYPHTLKDTK